MEFGKRLLPQIVDHHANTNPTRVYASISKSTIDMSSGFEDVTMKKLAAVVNRLSWWLNGLFGEGGLSAIAYIGPTDIRYAAVFLAGVKCGYKVLFISPRNQIAQNQRMLVRSECKALLYAEEMASVAKTLTENNIGIAMQSILTLNELLETPEDTKHYPYDKTFDEAINDPCLILHSSGSTGDPKLVTMTHGTFSVIDLDRNMPVPEGRRPQNAALFDFEDGGKIYSCFPPYHLAGVHAYMDLPIFSESTTIVFGPTTVPPSGYLLSEILKLQKVRGLYIPPVIIEQWASEPIVQEQAKELDFILYGGGPLSPSTGDMLDKVTNLCQVYGSLEVGQIQLLVPQPGDWSYMEINPYEEADMQPQGDGTFELVLHQTSKLASRRCLWYNFPDVKTWRTGDLFLPHPTKPGLWRFSSRIDDLVVLSSTHKIRPMEMETVIQGNPLISGAMIAGQGKPEPMLIIEPKPTTYDGNSESFLEKVWPAVQEANNIAPAYARIQRSRIVIADPERPFLRAPKGSIVRKLTVKLYADEIDQIYKDNENDAPLTNGATIPNVDTFILPGLKQFVRLQVKESLPGVSLSDTDNLFVQGLDSLGSVSLRANLQKGLVRQGQTSSGPPISLGMLYRNPTIEGLASVILEVFFGRGTHSTSTTAENGDVDVQNMRRTVQAFTKDLPQKSASSNGWLGDGDVSIALIGPRGSLGPNIIAQLMANPRVKRIYCLNRGNDGREKLRELVKDRKLSYDVDDGRLSFMPIELGKLNLGLSDSHYDELVQNANVLIHSAWKVKFNWTFDSYKIEHLHSVRELVHLCSLGRMKPRIVFISSILSVQKWPTNFSIPVPERPVELFDVSSSIGYGQSKHVSERILEQASAVSGVPVTIIRVGQIGGPTTMTGGSWPMDEWVPSLTEMSRDIKAIPSNLPPIAWVPVDLTAKALSELALAPEQEDIATSPLKVFNLVNPNTCDWQHFINVFQKRLGQDVQQVTMKDWVGLLEGTQTETMSEAAGKASTKLLPFFQHMAEESIDGVPFQVRFDTYDAVKASPTMAEMKAVDEPLIDLWFQQWGF